MKVKRLKTDLHLHSKWSDGKLGLEELVDLHGRMGFDAIAITDHISDSTNIVGQVSKGLKLSLDETYFEDYLNDYRKQKRRAQEKYGMNLIFGYEITKNSFWNHRSCHVLILGVEKLISPNLDVPEILKQAQKENGIVIAAHPFHTGEVEFQSFHLWEKRDYYKQWIDAWEISIRKTVCSEVMESGLPLIASSDFHHIKHFSSWKTWLYCQNDLASIKQCLQNRQVDFFLDQAITS